MDNCFYHVTAKENLDSILKKGLEPSLSQSSLKAIFLSNDLLVSLEYANMRADKNHVVLKIETSVLDENSLGPDNYELQDWLDNLNDDERDEIGGIEQWHEVDWKSSLAWCQQIAYYKNINSSNLQVCIISNDKIEDVKSIKDYLHLHKVKHQKKKASKVSL